MLVTLSIAHLFGVFKKKKKKGNQPKKQQLCAQQLPAAGLELGLRVPLTSPAHSWAPLRCGQAPNLPGHTQSLNSTLAWVDFLLL